MRPDVVVIGAGIAGLACARDLANAGQKVVVLERSRGVGGRCATRRVDGTVVDHGLTFFHGHDDRFREALESAGKDDVVTGWPRRVRGKGAPCQPSAMRPRDWRLALGNGVTVFPKWLAHGLEVRFDTHVSSIEPGSDHWRVEDEGGQQLAAGDLVLTMPVPQALQLMEGWREVPREIEILRSLFREIGFVSTLTVIALYPPEDPAPDWHMWYPEESAILQLISHDSSKRRKATRASLVLQALPAWSRGNREKPEAEWAAAMLEEAGRLAGRWATEPETMQTHRWRHARVGSGGDLTGPVLIELPGGRRVGFAGDGFSPGGGVQASWRSGRELARRLLEDQAS